MIRHFILPLILVWTAASVVHAQVTEADVVIPEMGQTTSASKQFRIIGGDRQIRNAFASYAERVKNRFLQALQKDKEDAWHHRILIRVAGRLTDPSPEESIDWKVSQFGNHFTLEIRVTLSAAFDRETMTAALLHMLMFEMALRDVEVAVNDQLIPRWLRVGLPGALKRREAGRPSGFFKTMFELNLITPADEILTATKDDVDAVSRSVYEASASGFVLMLLDQQGGPAKFAKLLHGHGGSHGVRGHDLLARYFPALRGTKERLEKTWILYCSKLAAPQAMEFLDPEATERALAEALQVSFLEFVPETAPERSQKPIRFLGNLWSRGKAEKDNEKGDEGSAPEDAGAGEEERPTQAFEGTLADFERFLGRADREEILIPVRDRLLHLNVRSFPLYRPLVQDYQEVVAKLLAGRPEGVAKHLEALAEERGRMTQLLDAIRIFMDEHERRPRDTKTGVFDNYLRQVREIERGSRASQDPISKYMDEVENALE